MGQTATTNLPDAIEIQKRIVAVVRQRSDIEFAHLVYLCWSVAGKFSFEELTPHELNEVLWKVKDWKDVPLQRFMEADMCECFRMYHSKSCPVAKYREAIEQ